MQKVSFVMKPVNGPFEVPYSTGYQTYSGLLSVIDDMDDGIAEEVHEHPFSRLVNSGLLGPFGWEANREYHKEVLDRDGVSYDLTVGVVDPDDRSVFEALMRAFVIEDRKLPLAHGEMDIREVQTDRMTHAEILDETADQASEANGVRFTFRSPTCRERYEGVWETHPDRIRLFEHLAERWNATVEEEALEVTPTADSLGQGLFTKVDPESYETHSIVVYREDPVDRDTAEEENQVASDGGHVNEVQGFTGEWEFLFKDASEALRTSVLALTRFAEYAGVGRHTARGAGTVTTEILGVDQ